ACRGPPDCNHAPVRLKDCSERLCGTVGERRGDDAARAEEGIERTVGVVARERKPARVRRRHAAHRDDSAVFLEYDGARTRVPLEFGGRAATAAEEGVERTGEGADEPRRCQNDDSDQGGARSHGLTACVYFRSAYDGCERPGK